MGSRNRFRTSFELSLQGASFDSSAIVASKLRAASLKRRATSMRACTSIALASVSDTIMIDWRPNVSTGMAQRSCLRLAPGKPRGVTSISQRALRMSSANLPARTPPQSSREGDVGAQMLLQRKGGVSAALIIILLRISST